jgi:uncharacterized protein YcfJ
MKRMLVAVAAALMAPVPAAFAASYTTEAPVISVTPIQERIQSSRNECWSEPVRVYERARNSRGGVYYEEVPVERNVPKCGTVRETKSVTTGYDVRYSYDGREYVTRMAQHPGNTVTIGVDVQPTG